MPSPATTIDLGAGRLLAASPFPAAHGFTTRRAGVSSGIFATLNFGNPGDLPAEQRDPKTNIRANLDLVLADLGLTGLDVVEVHQVHGAAVHVVRPGRPAHAGPRDTFADALVTDDPARVLAVRVADCAPVLLASADARVVGAVHAGWRGVVQGVAPAAIAAMLELGASDLHAVIGPCIGQDAFEVGPEVVEEFTRALGPVAAAFIRPGRADRSHIDLKAALRAQLLAAGLSAGRISVIDACTAADLARFFSHRRDAGKTGRMMALIAARPPAAARPR
jgi:YfiH family protein